MKNKKFTLLLSVVALSSMVFNSFNLKAQPGYLAGDFHQHTTFTDGSYPFMHVMAKSAEFELDWWANSEHGGYRYYDGRFSDRTTGEYVYYDEAGAEFLGDAVFSGGHQAMWRWQIIRDFSFPILLEAREKYPDKTIIQGVEWNVPGHEHGSVGIITGQFDKDPNANAVAEFEYKFDGSDRDITGGAANGWVKSTKEGHEKTLEAITWLQENHPNTSWVVPAHPERKGYVKGRGYLIEDFRDMNNAGPSVCFGFESVPGHQKSSGRGGYGSGATGGGTFGGSGYYSAIVGGLWDAMLSEGRHFWLFANSDFHSEGGDFYPGEYQKTYTYTYGSKKPEMIVKGLRSGNSYVVEGDLIDYLKFEIKSDNTKATMGGKLYAKNKYITITIKVHDPEGKNFNTYSDYNTPQLDHIDLIEGVVSGYISPEDPLYTVPSVSTTKVIARFDANGNMEDANGIISTQWKDKGNGWKEMSLKLNVDGKKYYRLRGSNLALNTENQIAEVGNPIADAVLGQNDAAKAFEDLWFYSNPVFVTKIESKGNGRNWSKGHLKTSIYPNPVCENVYITNNEGTGFSYTLCSISGKKIIENITDENSVELNMNNLKKGVYILTVSSGDAREIHKIIKK